MRFLLPLLLLVSTVVRGENIILDQTTPNEALAVQVLIDQFENTDIVIRREPWLTTKPVFVIYAEAAASLGEVAIDPLIEALDGSRQTRIGAAVGLGAIGSASIRTEFKLHRMLMGNDSFDRILACGIIRGIGPDAFILVDSLRLCLHHDNFHVQYWACRALSSIGSGANDATEDLLIVLKMGIASVRRNAAITLGNIQDGMDQPTRWKVIDALQEAKKDRCQPVRAAATEAEAKIIVFYPS